MTPTLAMIRASFVGNWQGEMSNPWEATQTVKFTFRQNGGYSAKNLGPGSGAALYYGTDFDSPAKKYAINDVHTNGDGRGAIQVTFDETDVEGEIDRIRFCSNGTRLDFVFFPTWLGHIGPVQYRLTRQP